MENLNSININSESSPELKITEDGSHTLFNNELNETYHSSFGAIQEAYHVFIKSGFDLLKSKNEISILEIGFGTGLNTFITYLESIENGQSVNYYGLEKLPINESVWSKLNYPEKLKTKNDLFHKIHQTDWNKEVELLKTFKLTKLLFDLESFEFHQKVDLIYFDAFGPNVQPNLWTESVFRKMHDYLNPNGILVTYSCKGDVKRALKSAGFTIEKIPGPPGKREMLRAFK